MLDSNFTVPKFPSAVVKRILFVSSRATYERTALNFKITPQHALMLRLAKDHTGRTRSGSLPWGFGQNKGIRTDTFV